jgi:hypothetical protein
LVFELKLFLGNQFFSNDNFLIISFLYIFFFLNQTSNNSKSSQITQHIKKNKAQAIISYAVGYENVKIIIFSNGQLGTCDKKKKIRDGQIKRIKNIFSTLLSSFFYLLDFLVRIRSWLNKKSYDKTDKKCCPPLNHIVYNIVL